MEKKKRKKNLWPKCSRLNCFNLTFFVDVYYNVELSRKHICFILERELDRDSETEWCRERTDCQKNYQEGATLFFSFLSLPLFNFLLGTTLKKKNCKNKKRTKPIYPLTGSVSSVLLHLVYLFCFSLRKYLQHTWIKEYYSALVEDKLHKSWPFNAA